MQGPIGDFLSTQVGAFALQLLHTALLFPCLNGMDTMQHANDGSSSESAHLEAVLPIVPMATAFCARGHRLTARYASQGHLCKHAHTHWPEAHPIQLLKAA